MKQRTVIVSPEAEADMAVLYDFVRDKAGVSAAQNYIDRVGALLAGLDLASERGRVRNEVRPGLRIIGFKKKLTVAFHVDEQSVRVVRIFAGGQDWEQVLKDD